MTIIMMNYLIRSVVINRVMIGWDMTIK